MKCLVTFFYEEFVSRENSLHVDYVILVDR